MLIQKQNFDVEVEMIEIPCKWYNVVGYGLLSPLRMVCGNVILPETGKPYLFSFSIFRNFSSAPPKPPADCPDIQ